MTEQETPFASDFKEEPYWWEAAPRPRQDLASIPRDADVVVIGSGVTGLNAALILARAGRKVVVYEAGDLGCGATTRNAGFIGRTLQHSFVSLANRSGVDRATAIYREMQAAFDAVAEVVRSENIACEFRISGRFNLASSPGHYDALAREFTAQRKHLGVQFEMLPRRSEHREIAANTTYFGGVLIPDLASLHPGLYQLGLLQCVETAGAVVVANTPVIAISKEGATSFSVATTRGSTSTRNVIVATNGYTDGAFPDMRRRLIPFASFMVASERLPDKLLERVLPTNRNYADSNHNALFARRSPDGQRILFGGLTGSSTRRGLRPVARRLTAKLGEMLPDLSAVKISYAWTGKCAGTFDLYPHIGERDGIHFALGHCFAGLPMGTYLGRKVAFKVLGSPEGKVLFDEQRFPTIPFYTGTPWFLPIALKYYDWTDRRLARRRSG